ncbi:hypothetical protein [Pontixanthobacter aquaemixtae]|uniref:Lipoprotein n=1 Tax=Pontixanthobacter aquaemixtae TaxID=1958940 RepID=A0A844ZRV3_9SPHN|nr:hypothetical protein [Pontixanthobacter aquaemixtae]MXO89820.1 hypothetical protein [Pontixanthobacter aquaemixtae]
MNLPLTRRTAAAFMAALGSLLLTSCFMIPGKFDAKLDLRSDGSFTYSYDGEIRLLGMTQLMEMSRGGNSTSVWNPDSQTCWGDEPTTADPAAEAVAEAMEESPAEEAAEVAVEVAAEEAKDSSPPPPVVLVPTRPVSASAARECSEEELAERRKQFEERQARSRERRSREAKQMQAVFGGIDPNDPDAGQLIAERLERQHGWNSVEYLGEGLFKVDFSIASRIDHDFTFPTMEGMSAGQPFLYVYRRDAKTVRVDAPGFGAGTNPGGAGGGSMSWLMIAGLERSRNSRDPDLAEIFKTTNGTFTITTDGEILANNTDEGYRDTASGRALVWQINSGSIDRAPPSALIKLAQ